MKVEFDKETYNEALHLYVKLYDVDSAVSPAVTFCFIIIILKEEIQCLTSYPSFFLLFAVTCI
jgi:hypothetical protein